MDMTKLKGLMLFILSSAAFANEERISISTKAGAKVTGRLEESFPGKHSFAAFRKIPFAKPPIGELRFAPAAETPTLNPGQEIDAAVDSSPACPALSGRDSAGVQIGPVQGAEDCLYLNVFSPHAALKEKKGLPVIVWIHGGAFVWGSSSDVGPRFVMESQDVVFVTFNYRLGALGWLSLEDETLRGNQGLSDQRAALKWVKENIASFGGDPAQVTLGGESAGGMSVMFHLISPKSEGLFNQAIVMSGSIVEKPSLRFSDTPSYYAMTLAEEIGCGDETDLVRCLRSKPFEEIVTKSAIFEKFFFLPQAWRPVVDAGWNGDDPTIPLDPHEAFVGGKYTQVPLIIGSTLDEGAFMLPPLLAHPDKFDEIMEDFDVAGPAFLLGQDEHSITEQDSSTAHLLRIHYLDGGKTSENFNADNAPAVVKMLSDIYGIGPAHAAARVLAETAEKNVYHYSYRFRGTFSTGENVRGIDLGVSHVDDCLLLFNGYFHDKAKLEELTESDLAMSKKMLKLFGTFAKTGVPHPNWTPINGYVDAPHYAVLDYKTPLKVTYEPEVAKNVRFLASIHGLIDAYRLAHEKEHPAITAMKEDMAKGDLDMDIGGDGNKEDPIEGEEDHDEL